MRVMKRSIILKILQPLQWIDSSFDFSSAVGMATDRAECLGCSRLHGFLLVLYT